MKSLERLDPHSVGGLLLRVARGGLRHQSVLIGRRGGKVGRVAGSHPGFQSPRRLGHLQSPLPHAGVLALLPHGPGLAGISPAVLTGLPGHPGALVHGKNPAQGRRAVMVKVMRRLVAAQGVMMTQLVVELVLSVSSGVRPPVELLHGERQLPEGFSQAGARTAGAALSPAHQGGGEDRGCEAGVEGRDGGGAGRWGG